MEIMQTQTFMDFMEMCLFSDDTLITDISNIMY